jgi:site-specific DNA recombinase
MLPAQRRKELTHKTAAIYARKSNDQNVDSDDKSVTRQIENARAFAQARGWTVVAEFTDDGISGAETRRLVAKQRMMAAAKAGAFDAVIIQAADRFSRRDGDEAFGELKQLAALVEVHFYEDGTQFASGDLASNVTGFLKAEFAAEFRRAIARKTAEKMLQKAQRGEVTGGRTLGYSTVNKRRVINVAEADVVREVFQRYADGAGFKTIAHSLNAQGHDFAPSTIRAMLRRDLYRGVITYGKSKKRDASGARRKSRRPKALVTLDAPSLRIVPEDLTEQVDQRLEGRRHAYLRNAKGRLLGRPVEGKHLLSGFLVCACGGHFENVRGIYVCATRRRKGATKCASECSCSAASLESVLLDTIEHEVFSDEFIERVLDSAFAGDPQAERAAHLEERKRLALEVTNLTTAIAQGGDLPTLVAALRERDGRLRTLDKALARPVERPDRAVLRAALELRRGEWKDLLRSQHVAQARLILQHVLTLPIRISNEPKPRWMTSAHGNGLLVGLIQSRQKSGVPNGIRTRVLALKGPRPGPLDDGDAREQPESLP